MSKLDFRFSYTNKNTYLVFNDINHSVISTFLCLSRFFLIDYIHTFHYEFICAKNMVLLSNLV